MAVINAKCVALPAVVYKQFFHCKGKQSATAIDAAHRHRPDDLGQASLEKME